MMPYCVGDPHSHCLIVQQRHPQFCSVASRGTVEVFSARIDHVIPVWRSWRWRIVAVTALMAICTLLMLLAMEYAVLNASLPTSGRIASAVLDQENFKPVGRRESDQFKGSDRLAASDAVKKTKHLEVVLGNEKETYSLDQAEIKEHGLRSQKDLQSVLIKQKMINPPQMAKPPLSHMRRRPRIAGIDCLSFSNRRILADTICTNKDISIFQSPDGSSGIPRYAVQIMNNCMSDCPPSDIHVFCGWFASALLVNPNSFKRLAFNDCLVNGGKPLRHGETLRFTYANSFMYPLRFKSASFCK